jgi:hypothetical protein
MILEQGLGERRDGGQRWPDSTRKPMEMPVARTSAKPETGAETRRTQRPARNPAHRDSKARPRQDVAPSPDSPKPHGDKLLDLINPLRHVAKDLT